MSNFDYYAFRIEMATKKILEEIEFYEQFKYTLDSNNNTDDSNNNTDDPNNNTDDPNNNTDDPNNNTDDSNNNTDDSNNNTKVNNDKQERVLFLKYVEYLKNRIGFSRGNFQTFRYDGFGNRHEIKKLDINSYGKEMDTYVFNKPWNKLKEFHKIMKIKEFVNTLPYKSNKLSEQKIKRNREMLIKELCGGLRTKKFLKGKSEITYNQKKMVIEDISSVELNRKTNVYDIDWDL